MGGTGGVRMILINRIKTFIKSILFHIWRGFPKSTQDQINYRYNICLSCDSFDKLNGECIECGCNVSDKKIFMNKLAWADQKCPLDKWGRVDVKNSNN